MNVKRLFAVVLAVLGSSVMMWADDENDIIQFADINVKTICVNKWDTDGDGELSKAEAAAVTSLGTAFRQNKNIKYFEELQFFTSLSEIDSEAFYQCYSLSSVVIPENVKYIFKKAFAGCWAMENIVLPIGVTSIGDYAFEGCASTEITLPEGLTSIGKYAFYNSRLTDVTVPSTVTYIGSMAFCQSSLVTATILGKPSYLEGTFASCKQLEHVNIPESVTMLKATFRDCACLKSIYIPKSVTSITDGTTSTFGGCYNLEEIIVDDDNTVYDSREGCNALIRTSGNHLMWGCRNTIIPATIQSIAVEAFKNVKGLKEITIPSGCTSIGSNAFKGCTDLMKVTSKVETPYSVSAFDDTTIKNGTLIVPKGCRDAYAQTDGWKNFLIYEEDENIYLKNYIDEQGVKYTLNDDGESYSVSGWVPESLAENVVIPSGIGGCPVIGIAASAFSGIKITSREYAYPSVMKTIIFPESITSIGRSAFSGCSNLERVYSQIQVPFAVTSAFPWGTAVLIVPKGKRADYKSVSGWSGAVIFEEGETIYNKVYTDEQGINYTLYQNDSGCYYSVTGHTDQLSTEIIILDNIDGCPVTTIGIDSFKDCTSLTKVTLPTSLTSINFSAFAGCISLKEFVSQIQDPSKTSVSTTKEVTDRAFVRVPVGTKAAYLNTSWKSFFIYEQGETVMDYAHYPTDEQGLKYTLYQNEQGFYYTVSGYTDALAERVTIPWSLDGLPVTDISSTFNNCTGLKYISIPESITKSSYHGWSQIFGGCSLTLALNHETVTGWSNMAFITGLELGDNVKTIGGSAFSGCTNLTTVDFPESLDSIGPSAFSNCKSLERIKLPDGIKYLNRKTFYFCTSLVSVVLPAQLLKIYGDWTNEGTFAGCTALQSIALPNTLTSIGRYTFSGCSSLTSFTIPENVADIGEYAFQGCSGLASVTIECPNVYSWFKDFTSIKNITLGEKVKYIGDSAFSGCTGLASFIIPNSVTSIGNSVFSGCTGLASINIPQSMTSIGNYAFNGCAGLISVNIGNGVTSIGNYAFNGCTGLISVSIGNGVTSIGYSVFSGCTELASIKVGEGNPKYDSRDNCNAIVETASNTLIIGCKSTAIPASVPKIGPSAFSGCTGLTSITIPNTLTGIGSSAFYGCTGLQNVTSYIRNPFSISAFDSQTLASATLTIPFGRTNIYKKTSGWGFQNIVEMEGSEEEITFIQFADATVKSICVGKWDENGDGEVSLYEAKLVTSIPNGMFSGKTSITSFDELKLFSNITTIEGYAFSGCKNLTSITLPSSLGAIGQEAFRTCTALTAIELPEGLTSIGQYAFNQSGLMEMTLPSTLTYIGSYALAGNIIHCRFATPISVGTPLIWNASSVILYVPQGSERMFREATGWKDFLIAGEGSEDTDWAEGQITVDVEDAGGLRLALVELDDEEITRLKIRGRLNSVDIKYLIEGKGKIANLESLDLSDVTLVYDGGCYKSTSSSSDVGLGSDNTYYYLTEYESYKHSVSLGLTSSTTTTYCSPNLIGAFQGKTYKHVVMPRIIRKAAVSVFSGCQYLQQVEFPGGLNCIDGSAFYNCKLLESINLENVDSVYHYAFRGCKLLRNVNHLENVKYIGESAFEGCSLLTGTNGTLSLPHVESIPNSAFNECINLKKIHLPNIRSVGYRAFYGCNSLATVVLPDELTTIGDEAFANCKKLQAVNCPTSLWNVNYTCFANTPWINSLPTEGGVRYWDAIALSSDTSDGVPTSFVFREGTTMIAARFLESLSSSYRDNVTALSLPTTLKYIGKSAFTGNNLNSLTLPENLDSIGEYAFNGSKQLMKVTLPTGLKQMGDNAFSSSPNLMIVNYNAIEAQSKKAFYSCSSLEKVNVGGSVRLLPKGIFSDCGNLTIVKFLEREGNIPLTIGDEAFNGCKNLVLSSLPSGTTEIGNSAFSGCTSLSSLALPSSLETIGSKAFYNACLSSCVIPDKVTVLHGETFSSCSNLTSVTLPEGLKIIGDKAFWNCYNLQSIDLPIGLDSIGYWAFSGCNSLTKLTIPATVTRLGEDFLYDCYNLRELDSRIARPNDLRSIIPLGQQTATAWYGYNEYYYHYDDLYESVTLTVPDGSKPLYKAAQGWSKFKNIQEASGSDVTATNKLSVSHTYITAGLTKGVEVRLKNNVTDFTSYQFDLVMPLGFSIATNSQGTLKVNKGNRYTDNAVTITAEKMKINQYARYVKYRIVCMSPNNTPITGDDGTLLTISIRPAEGVSAGDYNATLENVIFVHADGTKAELDYVPFTITVEADEEGRMGDVNHDGEVDVADVVQTVNYILDMPLDVFSTRNADVNFDGEINVGDVASIIGIILGRSNGSASVKAMANITDDSDVTLSGEYLNNLLEIGLLGEQAYTAFQMRIILPEDISQESVNMVLQRGKDHVLVSNWLSEHEVVVVAYSLSHQAFTGTEGTLLKLVLDQYTEEKWYFEDIIFSNADGTTRKYTPKSISYATSIDNAKEEKQTEDDCIYDLSGRKVNNGKLPSGIYIRNGKKVILK